MEKMQKMMRLVSAALILVLMCACGAKSQVIDSSTAPVTESRTADSSAAPPESADEPAEPLPEESLPAEPLPTEPVYPLPEEAEKQETRLFTFQPKVCSVYHEEVFGKTMCETWFNLVDAVMAGEDTFACPDQHTYDWVMGQFPETCFPVLVGLIDYAWDRENSVIDGVASFTYLKPYEEVSARISAFAEQIEGILNDALKYDYSDFEKMLALYEYFASHYEYDYEAADRMNVEYVDTITAINFFETGTGVCQQIAIAYSYLLMQAGVEATTMGGNRSWDEAGHEWSYVRLGGRNYHIDPTFGLGNGYLDYFLMTDDQREAMDSYLRSRYRITSNYSEDHPHPDYTADDETFSPLWGSVYREFDHEAQMLEYWKFDENGQYTIYYFDYSGY
ncbi:MAG: transglutaminase family protein [Lachnospiraceae bacterium]|nr:transglutaminase family protein [Lachnospiraceae bacterium]